MSQALTPEVLWAQRSNKTEAAKNFIYLTIAVPDVQASKLKLELKSQSLKFAGHSDSLKRDYFLELEFFAEIDEAESKISHTPKNIEMILRKKEAKEEFWPRLLKDSKKVHFLKTDFDKWVDEDEQDEAPEDEMGNMGGMGGMPGMGDMGGMMGGAGGDFGGIDFSKLGGAGMGDDGEEAEEEEEQDDDEEMPELEGDDKAESSKAKIEEV